MDSKNLHRLFAAIALVVSFTTYYLTVQPTVPFWDCGEFTAAAVEQQVPHPPGAPLFLMIGKVFHLLPIGNSEDPGMRINMVSVTASAVTVWLLYLILVMGIRNLRKDPIESVGDAIAVYGSALVGALAYNFSDTFWFNGVESEVYALSSLFVQVVVYMMMRWNDEADKPGHERWLLGIAYLIGLSVGVHLLSILAIFSIVYLVYFKKYEFSWKSFAITSFISLVAFWIIYKFIITWMPAMLAGKLPFRNELREYLYDNNPLFTIISLAIVIAGIVGVAYGYKNKIQLLALGSLSFVMIILGYTTYTHIILRSEANPPMNENAPKSIQALLSYIGRDQYGEAPSYPRRYETGDRNKINNYRKKDSKGNYVYGEWYEPTSKTVTRKDGSSTSIPAITKVNTSGELNYFLKYQVYHMYWRYFLWNFVGRSSDLQDSDFAFFSTKEAEIRNFNSGFKSNFPIRFFGLPLILGLIGLFFQYKSDPKMWWVYLVMFLMMGMLATIAQNQQEPQPRERDYFYAGSFMVWCFWIGMGCYALIDYLQQKSKSFAIAGGIVVVSLIAAPVNMAMNGWKIHSRAGNYLPFDYSYNILQSCEKDAILFTNGDNDTFPLWYLQDVAGIRRDVRIVNLSLGNTLWYVDQLKNLEPWGAKKIPLSFSDESMRMDENEPGALSYSGGYAEEVSIPVPSDILKQYTTDPAVLAKGTMDFTFTGRNYGQENGKTYYLFQVQDKLIKDILTNVKFSRPIYFSTTSGYPGSETFVGLGDFCRLEGMVYRVCPARQKQTVGGVAINEEVMEKCMMNTLDDNTAYKEPHYGFKLRSLNDNTTYFDEHHRNYLDSYRRIYLQYAGYLLQEKRDKVHAKKVLDKLITSISPQQFPINYIDMMNIAEFYQVCGDQVTAKKFAQMIVDRTSELITTPAKMEFENGSKSPYYSPYLYQTDAYTILGNEPQAKSSLQMYIASISLDARANFRTDALKAKMLINNGNYAEAEKEIERIGAMYQANPSKMGELQELTRLRFNLMLMQGKSDTATGVMVQ